ncbi:hypothetical protein D3C79_621840 [compost metagenome]
MLELDHRLAHVVRNLQCVGAGQLVDQQRRGLFVVHQGAQRILPGGQFDPCHVAQAGDAAIRGGAHDHLTKRFFGIETPAGIDRDLVVHSGRRRRGADHPGGGIDVLLTQGLDHIARCQVTRRELARIEPDAHGVVAGTGHLHLADTVDAGEPVLDVEQGIVAQVLHVVALVGRAQVHHHGQVGSALDGGHAQPLHRLWQPRQRLVDAVLHPLLGQVGVGAQAEGHGQGQLAIRRGMGIHVQHAFDAVDLLFDGRGDGFSDSLRMCARILSLDHH